jgi:hypothetical protein
MKGGGCGCGNPLIGGGRRRTARRRARRGTKKIIRSKYRR